VEAANTLEAEARIEYLAEARKDYATVIGDARKVGMTNVPSYRPENDPRNLEIDDLIPVADMQEAIDPLFKGLPKESNQYQVIAEFASQLKKHQIRLYLVPVPTKAMVYYDRITDAVKDNGRFDPYHRWLYKELKADGRCSVADPMDVFLKYRKYYKLYWAGDTRWTSTAAMIVAKAAADEASISKINSHNDWDANDYLSAWVVTQKVLPRLRPDGKLEVLDTIMVGKRYPTFVFKHPKPDPAAENLIIGDECVQLFHNSGQDIPKPKMNAGANVGVPNYYGPGCGFPEHFARITKAPVDVMYGDFTDVNTCRKELEKHPDRLKGKKRIFFVFSASAFSRTLWQHSNILPPAK